MQTTPVTEELLRGAIELERNERGIQVHRLPAWARAQSDDPQLHMVEAQGSGVRLVFSTSATVIELDTIPTKRVYVGAPRRPDGVYDLVVDGELTAQGTVTGGDTLTINMATGSFDHEPGEPGTLRFDGLPGHEKVVELWLPHDETALLVELRSDAPLSPVPSMRRTWLHHGSSISHGSNAAHPTAIWPAIAARLGGVDLINLGLGGSAMVDPFTSRLMRDTPADVISVKAGINLVNADAMRLRTFVPGVHGFLDTIREGHPETPLLVVSPIFCGIHENDPGPTTFDLSTGKLAFRATGDPADVAAGKLTLRVVREQLAAIVARRADPHLHYLDGLSLFGAADADELPLPDALHPDTAAHSRIGERFAALAFAAGGAFA